MVAWHELVVGKIEAWLAVLLAFELRAAGAACEEGGKRPAQIEKGLTRGVLCDILCPAELLALDGVKLLLECEGVRLQACFILAVPFGQCPIPGEARGSSGFGKVGCLLRCGMQSDLVGTNHWYFPLHDARARRHY